MIVNYVQGADAAKQVVAAIEKTSGKVIAIQADIGQVDLENGAVGRS